jgi:4-aminobutyrate aminotransferase-like enzyme
MPTNTQLEDPIARQPPNRQSAIQYPVIRHPVIQHAGEDASNAQREIAASTEPRSLRTFTPSLAVFSHSAGSYHFTPDGRKLADFTSGVLVANLGHNPSRWWSRVLRYMKLDNLDGNGEFLPAVALTSYNAVTELETRASQRLLANMRSQPGGRRMEQVMWAASGSEAVHKALTAAMSRRPGAGMILATRHGFHGKKGLAGAVTGCESDPHRDPRVRFISFPRDECCNFVQRRETIDLSRFRRELDALADEFGNQLCCLITEPYLGGGGSYHPQIAYLQLLEEFCRQYDLLFILDEVQSNFGRTGAMYAYTTYGLEPDIVLLGKGMGNGVPVDAAVGSAEAFAHLNYGESSDTWSGHALGCAAVLATLDAFEQGGVLEQAAELSKVIETHMSRLMKLPAVAAVRGEGTVWGVECAAAGSLSANETARQIVLDAYLGDDRKRAIHLLGPLAGCVIRIAPPLVMPPDEADEYFNVLHDIIARVTSS